MFSIPPEYLPEILTAIGGIIGTGGLVTLLRIWREPTPKPGSPDAAALALVENTKATITLAGSMSVMDGKFGENLKLFNATLEELRRMAKDMEFARDHLNAIRNDLHRRG